jgi:hypothetical protein
MNVERFVRDNVARITGHLRWVGYLACIQLLVAEYKQVLSQGNDVNVWQHSTTFLSFI